MTITIDIFHKLISYSIMPVAQTANKAVVVFDTVARLAKERACIYRYSQNPSGPSAEEKVDRLGGELLRANFCGSRRKSANAAITGRHYLIALTQMPNSFFPRRENKRHCAMGPSK